MVVLLFLVSFITFVVFFLFPSADPAQLRAGRQPNPALVAHSAPVYWLGLVALYLFSSDIGKFKVPFFKGAGSYVPFSQDPSIWFQSLLLPWFVLAAAFAALYARLLRANLIETMSEDYIRTARAKGLRERRVVLRHGVRSAITPIVTAAGLGNRTLHRGA